MSAVEISYYRQNVNVCMLSLTFFFCLEILGFTYAHMIDLDDVKIINHLFWTFMRTGLPPFWSICKHVRRTARIATILCRKSRSSKVTPTELPIRKSYRLLSHCQCTGNYFQTWKSQYSIFLCRRGGCKTRKTWCRKSRTSGFAECRAYEGCVFRRWKDEEERTRIVNREEPNRMERPWEIMRGEIRGRTRSVARSARRYLFKRRAIDCKSTAIGSAGVYRMYLYQQRLGSSRQTMNSRRIGKFVETKTQASIHHISQDYVLIKSNSDI